LGTSKFSETHNDYMEMSWNLILSRYDDLEKEEKERNKGRG